MSEYLISGESLVAVADAIRERAGSSDGLTVAAMPDAIRALSGDAGSTLPPPVTNVSAVGGDQAVTVSFAPVSAEYEQYLGVPAYRIVLKEGSMPQSPEDGTIIHLYKTGAVIA